MSKDMFNFENTFSNKEKDELLDNLTGSLTDFIKGMYDFCKKIELVNDNEEEEDVDSSCGTIKDILDGFVEEFYKDDTEESEETVKNVNGVPCTPANPYNKEKGNEPQVVTDNKDSNGNYIACDGTPCQPADPYEKKESVADSLKKYYEYKDIKNYDDEVELVANEVVKQMKPTEKGGLITKVGDILRMEFPIYSVLSYPQDDNCINTIIKKLPSVLVNKTGFSQIEIYKMYCKTLTIIFKF